MGGPVQDYVTVRTHIAALQNNIQTQATILQYDFEEFMRRGAQLSDIHFQDDEAHPWSETFQISRDAVASLGQRVQQAQEALEGGLQTTRDFAQSVAPRPSPALADYVAQVQAAEESAAQAAESAKQATINVRGAVAQGQTIAVQGAAQAEAAIAEAAPVAQAAAAEVAPLAPAVAAETPAIVAQAEQNAPALLPAAGAAAAAASGNRTLKTAAAAGVVILLMLPFLTVTAGGGDSGNNAATLAGLGAEESASSTTVPDSVPESTVPEGTSSQPERSNPASTPAVAATPKSAPRSKGLDGHWVLVSGVQNPYEDMGISCSHICDQPGRQLTIDEASVTMDISGTKVTGGTFKTGFSSTTGDPCSIFESRVDATVSGNVDPAKAYGQMIVDGTDMERDNCDANLQQRVTKSNFHTSRFFFLNGDTLTLCYNIDPNTFKVCTTTGFSEPQVLPPDGIEGTFKRG